MKQSLFEKLAGIHLLKKSLILSKPEFHYRFQISTPSVPILSLNNAVNALSLFFEIHMNIILPPTPK